MTRQQRSPHEAILAAAGYSAATLVRESYAWRIYHATFRGPSWSFEEHFLLLSAECRLHDLHSAGQYRRAKLNDSSLTVLTPLKRLANLGTKKEIEALVGTSTSMTVREFLERAATSALGSAQSEAATPEAFGLSNFVEPDIHFPGDTRPRQGLEPLLQWLSSSRQSEKHNVAVLLAPAGTGKTTFALELFRRLLQHHPQPFIPLLVHDQQWLNVSKQADMTFERLWSEALAEFYPGAVIGPDRLFTFFSYGTICPILDGVDELCARFPRDFSPIGTLERLLADFGAGRLLLTSRDIFWHESIDAATRSEVLHIDLQRFTEHQRDIYVNRRFPEEKNKRRRAFSIFNRLRQGATKRSAAVDISSALKELSDIPASYEEERVDLLPFVVMLATEAADVKTNEGLHRYAPLLATSDPLKGLLLAFCERERERHQMEAAAENQLKVLETLAVRVAQPFGGDALRNAIHKSMGTHGDDEYKRFTEHGLLRRVGTEKASLSIRFAFVADYLIARVAAEWVRGGSDNVSGVRALQLLSDNVIATERCAELLQAEARPISDHLVARWRTLTEEVAARAGYVQLVLRLARNISNGLRSETTRFVLSVLGDIAARRLMGAIFIGTMKGLDLCDITLYECTIRDCEIDNCVFDSKTYFKNCTIDGSLTLGNNTNLRLAKYDPDTFISLEARAVLQLEIGQTRNLPVTESQIIAWVGGALRKFRRGAIFVLRSEEAARRALLNSTQHADSILDALISSGVITVVNDRKHSALMIADSRSVRIFLDNRTPVGAIERALRILFGDLCS